MLQVIEFIQQHISLRIDELFKLNVPHTSIEVEVPSNDAFGDYSTNIAMVLAKELKQNPIDIAKKLCHALEENLPVFTFSPDAPQIFSAFEAVAPGFINIRYSSSWLLSLTNMINQENASYGSFALGERIHIALEHSNVNPNKAPHIGHLRNAAIGQFVEKIYEFAGNNVNVQYYSNDVGVQVATSFLGSTEISDIRAEDYDRFDYYAWDIYSRLATMLVDDKALQERLNTILQTIEDENHPLSTQVAAFADRILWDQIQTFNELGISYDVIVHERDIVYTKMWEACFAILKENPNFYLATEGKSAGCWLLRNSKEQNSDQASDFEKDKIIVRSNGVPTYTGKDIAYHMWKFGLLNKDFGYKSAQIKTQQKALSETTTVRVPDADITFSNADVVIDIIDQKQTYAISAVKESLCVLGYEKQAQNMHHINYGFVYLSPETASQLGLETDLGLTKYEMSGRRGIGVKILDFVHMVDTTLETSYGDFPAKRVVRNGAILFEMLKYNTFNDLVFDIDTALNVKGFSGPYIQYTHARICSVLKKGNYTVSHSSFSAQNLAGYDKDALALISTLARFDEVNKRSAAEFAPNLLCEYLFKVAKLFNTYYNDHSFIGAESLELRAFRLNVANCTKIVLSNGLGLLGIMAPERV